MSAPELKESIPIKLDDGRVVRVLAYEDGSIRFRITGATCSYVMTEAFFGGSVGQHIIIKLKPGVEGCK
jgi:hypothetical protein